MILEIPEEVVVEQLTSQVVSIILKEVDKRLSMITKTIELSPYPNKSEIKKVLKIGDDRLDEWIAQGLPIQIWGKDHRVERETLQEFLRSNKEIKMI